MTYAENWNIADSFTLEQAAYLWCEQEPKGILVLGKVSAGTPPGVAAMFGALQNAAVMGSLKVMTVGVMHRLGDHSESVVSRSALEDFARAKKQFPKFLFDTVMPEPEPAVSTNVELEKSRGGRPPIYDWDSCIGEIVRIANSPDGLPEKAKLIEHLKGWFSSHYDSEPAPSELYKRVRPIYAYLDNYPK